MTLASMCLADARPALRRAHRDLPRAAHGQSLEAAQTRTRLLDALRRLPLTQRETAPLCLEDHRIGISRRCLESRKTTSLCASRARRTHPLHWNERERRRDWATLTNTSFYPTEVKISDDSLGIRCRVTRRRTMHDSRHAGRIRHCRVLVVCVATWKLATNDGFDDFVWGFAGLCRPCLPPASKHKLYQPIWIGYHPRVRLSPAQGTRVADRRSRLWVRNQFQPPRTTTNEDRDR